MLTIGLPSLLFRGHQRREIEDLIARMDELEARGGDASGALNLGKIIKGAAKIFLRENDELLARRSVDFYLRYCSKLLTSILFVAVLSFDRCRSTRPLCSTTTSMLASPFALLQGSDRTSPTWLLEAWMSSTKSV